MVGLEFGGLKNRNLALLAKWGWRHESDSLRCRVVQSIHVKDQFSRHMAGKFGMSLHSPWMSISKAWLQVEALPSSSWVMVKEFLFGKTLGMIFLHYTLTFPQLYRIALLHNG